MKKHALLITVVTAVLVLGVPFAGGGGPGFATSAVASGDPAAPPLASIPVPAVASISAARRVPIASTTRVTVPSPLATTISATEQSPRAASTRVADQSPLTTSAGSAPSLTHDWEHLAQKPVPKPVPVVSAGGSTTPGVPSTTLDPQGQACPRDAGGSVGGAPGTVSTQGVAGTTSDDLASFAYQYNAIRVANCLQPIPYGNFRYDSCMEARLFWMAESPSPDPLDAWGHMGSVRIDGVPSTGCDGNLAGGSGNTGATVAQKWWNSSSHRASLYRPGTSIAGVCIAFALTHGGIDEPYSFTRSAARWTTC